MPEIKTAKNYEEKRVSVRVTSEQQIKINAVCKKYKCSVSDWIRHKIDEEKL